VATTFNTGLEGFESAPFVFEDLPQGQLARELASEKLGEEVPRLADGRWVVAVMVDGLRLFAAGDEDVWTIFRANDTDEADATAAAAKLHKLIGWRHSEWDEDR
jgi:hypothetical protein